MACVATACAVATVAGDGASAAGRDERPKALAAPIGPVAPTPPMSFAPMGSAPTSAGAAFGGLPGIAANGALTARADEERRRLASPSAAAERKRSRDRYRGMSAAKALEVAKDTHPVAASRPAWSQPSLRATERVERHLGDHAVRVKDTATGRAGIAVAGSPLVSDVATGKRAPIDLSLARRARGFEPVNPLVETALPRRLDDGIRFIEDDWTFVIDGVDERAAQVVGDKLFFANTDVDTDVIVEPLPSGVETFHLLRSPSAPAEVSFAVSGAATVLRPTVRGEVDILGQDGQTVLARIEAAYAVDAQGRDVPVRYTVEGSRLVLAVDHRGGDFAYPIMVDPIVRSGAAYNFAGWAYDSPWSWKFTAGWCPSTMCTPDYGLWIQAISQNYNAGEFGAWRTSVPNAPGGSGITYRAEFPHLRQRPVSSNASCVYVGLEHPTLGWQSALSADPITGLSFNGPWGWCGTVNDSWPTVCVHSQCENAPAPAGTRAQFVQQMPNTGPRSASNTATMRDAVTYTTDFELPSFTGISFSDAAGATGWTRWPTLYGGFTALDPGLGLLAVDAESPTAPVAFDAGGPNPYPCEGHWGAPCPHSWNTTYSVSPVSEGPQYVELWAGDVLGHVGTHNQHFKYDKTEPDVRYSGNFEPLNGRTVSQPTKLEVTALDGSPSAPRAGVQWMQVKVNGTQDFWTGDLSCPQGSCALPKQEWTFDPDRFGVGTHTVEVRVSDWAGNVASRTWTVTAGAGELTSVTEGQRTARRLVLQAKRLRGDATNVRFEYLHSSNTWQPIGDAYLATRRGGSVTAPVPVVQQPGTPPVHQSDPLVYDVFEHLRNVYGTSPSGSVTIRPVFNGAPGTDVKVTLAANGIGTEDAQAPVGPLDVDVLTGNATFSRTDVDIQAFKAPLTLTRTYNSRDRDPAAQRPFGPGWSVGAFAMASEAGFTSLRNMAQVGGVDGGTYVLLKTSAGDEVAFSETPNETRYVSPPGLEALSLTREHNPDLSISQFVLRDNDSAQTLYFRPDGAPGGYQLSEVTSSGNADKATYIYEAVPGAPATTPKRLKWLIAPTELTCTPPTMQRGCRALELVYGTSTTGGDFPGHVREIALRAWDSQSGTMTSTSVMRYSYDTSGRLTAAWDPRISPALKEQYAYNTPAQPINSRMVEITPPGQHAWTLSYQPMACTGQVICDQDDGRLRAVSRPTLPPATGTATYTIVYRLSPSGVWNLDPDDLDHIGQTDFPQEGAAVFPPDDDPPADPPVHYATATSYFVNGDGRLVNRMRPGFKLSTTEYDIRGNVVRELTPANRVTALQQPTLATRAAKAKALSTLRKWESNDAGSRMVEELGPEHELKLQDGTVTTGRARTTLVYDQNRPAGDSKNYNLATTVTRDALVGTTGHDAQVTQTKWDFAKRLPTETIDDPNGLNRRTVIVYDSHGLAVEKRQPSNPNGGGAGTLETVRYSGGASSVAACANKPEWLGLPCVERLAAQPTTSSSRPAITSSTFTYDRLGNVLTVAETAAGGTSRNTSNSYDSAGRQTGSEVTASDGVAVPRSAMLYHQATGRQHKTQLVLSGLPLRTVERDWDALGRIERYTDASGEETVTTYDIADRPLQVTDSQGTREFGYLADGSIAHINDDDLSIQPEFDADGRLSSQLFLDNGLRVDMAYDATGAAVRRTYVKDECTTNCVWYESENLRDAHGRVVSDTDSFTAQRYSYDKANRLVATDDRTSPTECVRRTYGFDANSNRTTQSTWPSAATCGSGTATSVTHAYDGADRLSDSGYVYDAFGRTTSVPASGAGGSALASTYYADDMVRSVSQDGLTAFYAHDPLQRLETRSTSAGMTTFHYADDSDIPTWSQTGSGPVERSVPDASESLAAIRRGSDVKLQITDLHGDVVAEIDSEQNPDRPTPLPQVDEFGVPETPASSPGGAIAQVGVTSNEGVDPGDTTLAIDRPAGTQVGDVLLAEISADNGADIWAPSGWTLVSGGEIADDYTTMAVYARTVASGEAASYAFSFSEIGVHQGGVKAFRNVDPASPPTATATAGTLGVASVTPTSAGSWMSAFNAADISMVGFITPQLSDGAPFSAQSWNVGLRTDTEGGGRAASSSSFGPLSTSPTPSYAGAFDADATMDPEFTGSILTLLKAAPSTSTPPPASGTNRYRYLGAKHRQTALPSGVVTMGARVYVPQLGRFLQPDPVTGGSANDYDYVNQDPVNAFDLDGRCARCVKELFEKAVKRIGKGGRNVTRQVRFIDSTGKVRIDYNISAHAVWRQGRRVVSDGEIRTMLEQGTVYWDNKHNNYTFVYATGKKSHMRLGYDPLTGDVTTVIKDNTKFNPNTTMPGMLIGRWRKVDNQ